jgi:hypothetical protein
MHRKKKKKNNKSGPSQFAAVSMIGRGKVGPIVVITLQKKTKVNERKIAKSYVCKAREGAGSKLAFEEFRFILFVVIIEKRSNKLHVNDFTLGRLHCVRYSLHRNLGIVMW